VRFSTLHTVHSGPHLTIDRFRQFSKQNHPMISTEKGIEIALSEEQPENAKSLRVERTEPPPNVTAESFVHLRKQYSEMVVIDEGMQID
jgi:hypothetical protein